MTKIPKEKTKAILLLSGGIDSPVAGHLMREKGLESVALHFANTKLAGNESVDKCKKLAKLIGVNKLLVIPFDEQQAELVRKCTHKYYYILMRRLMLKIAEQVATKEGAAYLITGDNLGQVGSQTLDNMTVIDRATNMEVLRPILCNDKVETINIAEKIGTFETSKGPEMCCLLGPKHPATKSKLDVILFEEQKIDSDLLISESINQMYEEKIL
jgi:thiamine biosynthesis protein ThiI